MDTDTANTRVEEFEFLITIMSDLAHKYQGHNQNLLEELISNLEYRKDHEETTVIAKCKSEEYQQQRKHIVKNHHHA